MISSKQGQPSTYSPNTQSQARRRMAGLFGGAESSPLSGGSAPRRNAGHMAETTLTSPTKATIVKSSALAGSILNRQAVSHSAAIGTGPSCSREDEGCFVPAIKQYHSSSQPNGVPASGERGTADSSLEDLPDEILYKIISHLPHTPHQLLSIGQLNRHFAQLAQANRFWGEVYHDMFGFTLDPTAAGRLHPSARAPSGCWRADGWEWSKDDGKQEDMQDVGILTGAPTCPEASEHEYQDSDTHPTSAKIAHLAAPDSTAGQPKSHRSRSAPIPVHYPTLVRSRLTLSRLLRNPSPMHRPSFETLSRHNDSVYCVHAIGRWLITGSRDRSIRLWRLGAFGPTGQPRRTRLIKTIHDAHEGSVLALHFELDEATGKGTLVAGSSDMAASVWDLDFSLERVEDEWDGQDGWGEVPTKASGRTRAPTITRRDTLKGHTAGVLDVLLTPSCIVTCSKDSSVRVYDRFDGRIRHVLQGHQQPVNCLAAQLPAPKSTSRRDAADTTGEHTKELVVSASADGTWIMWDLATGQQVRRKEGTSGLACVAWQGDYIVTGDNDRLVKVFDANTTELLRTFKGHQDLVRTISIDLQEGLVVSGSYDKSIMIWDIYTGELLRRIASQHTSLVFDLQMTSTRLISASHDKSVQVASLATGLPYLDIMA